MAKLLASILQLFLGKDHPGVAYFNDEVKGSYFNIALYAVLLIVCIIIDFQVIDTMLLTGVAGVLLLIPGMVISGLRIAFAKNIIKKDEDSQEGGVLVKKYDYVNLRKYTTTFSSLGFMFVLSFLIIVFSLRSYDEVKMLIGEIPDFEDTEIEPPPTQHEPPPPPPPVVEIDVVPDEEIIEEEPEIEEVEMEEEEVIEEIVEEVVEEEEIFMVVEEMPEFPGGPVEMMKYLRNNISYPPLAVDNGVEGTVIVTFVVNKGGNIVDAVVARGIGAGCDEEALRVIRAMPSWKAGMQRGKPVKVKYSVPVKFKLG